MKKKLKLLSAYFIFTITPLVVFSQPIKHLSVLLPGASRQLDNNRFQSSLSYENTKRKFYYQFLRSGHIKQWGEEINLPHVRMIAYKNYAPKAEFLFINIYLNVQTGLTNIFFLTKDDLT
jgi:hypothetical protein